MFSCPFKNVRDACTLRAAVIAGREHQLRFTFANHNSSRSGRAPSSRRRPRFWRHRQPLWPRRALIGAREIRPSGVSGRLALVARFPLRMSPAWSLSPPSGAAISQEICLRFREDGRKTRLQRAATLKLFRFTMATIDGELKALVYANTSSRPSSATATGRATWRTGSA
jgi:hypothetical protein